MNREVISLHKKADLVSILMLKPNGIVRDFILSKTPTSKLEKVVFLAYSINKLLNINVYIECKYLYGKRDKRIELFFIYNRVPYMCKISQFNEFDKDSLLMDNIISDIKKNYSSIAINIKCIIFFKENFNKKIVLSFAEKLENDFLFINFNNLRTEFLKNGLSH